jgi:hypothetical protein
MGSEEEIKMIMKRIEKNRELIEKLDRRSLRNEALLEAIKDGDKKRYRGLKKLEKEQKILKHNALIFAGMVLDENADSKVQKLEEVIKQLAGGIQFKWGKTRFDYMGYINNIIEQLTSGGTEDAEEKTEEDYLNEDYAEWQKEHPSPPHDVIHNAWGSNVSGFFLGEKHKKLPKEELAGVFYKAGMKEQRREFVEDLKASKQYVMSKHMKERLNLLIQKYSDKEEED